jgi:hypothetical protein
MGVQRGTVQLDRAALVKLFKASPYNLKGLAHDADVPVKTLGNMLNSSQRSFRHDGVARVAAKLGVPPEALHLDPSVAELKPGGSIDQPTAGTRLVNRCFTVSGTLHDLPADGSAWIVVARGTLHWPKEPALSGNTSWRVDVFEGGQLGCSFDLLLWAVPARGTQEIREWLRRGDEQGDYPGLRTLTGIQTLASVRQLMVEDEAVSMLHS